MHRVRVCSAGLIGALGLLLLFGCRAAHEAPERHVAADAGARDAVIAALRSAEPEAMRAAFAALPRYRYTRYTRTDQYDAAHRRLAFRERATRHDRPGEAPTVLYAAAAGAFDFGYLGAFVSATVDEHDVSNLPDYILLEDPPYLSARNRAAYSFHVLPDTLLWDTAARVIEVQARPGEGDAQTIRHARFYLERGSNAVIALSLERREKSLLFREESRFYLRIRPAPDGGWVPFNTHVQVRLHVPFRKPQVFHTVSTYYHYEPA